MSWYAFVTGDTDINRMTSPDGDIRMEAASEIRAAGGGIDSYGCS
jgi:hypothetical protein